MAKAAKTRKNPALRLALVRQIHVYIGVLIAPSVIFFAVSGALQLFSLHESHGDYQAPALIQAMASVHKDQVIRIKAPDARDAGAGHHHPGADEQADGDHHHDDGPKASTLALKVFFLAVAAGLAVSTLLGLWMALLYNRRKAVVWGLLVVGVVAPVVVLLA